jgi:predicted Rossmann-fold nucleotide-binding protein
MEAANRGAARVEGSRSMGLGVVLPRECGANPWGKTIVFALRMTASFFLSVDDDLNFKYHYFFTRKFWMVYMSMGTSTGYCTGVFACLVSVLIHLSAVVACPGGYGTLD